MQNHDINGEEIQKLEEQIQKLGTPFASNEPEPLYWANFRIRVMGRIAQNEQRAYWYRRLTEFVTEHVLGTSIAVSAATILVALTFLLNPFTEIPRVAVVPPPVAAPAPMAAQATEPTQKPIIAHRSNRSHESYAAKDLVKLPDFASITEPLAASDEEHPVNLEELSKPELEAVLKGIENNKE